MASIAEIRQQYPQYDDMSDEDLARALHKKHYSDMPEADFMATVGLSGGQAAEGGFMGPPQKPYRGGVLPFSIDETGKKSLDFSAGIPGLIGEIGKSLGRAVTTPGDVMSGELAMRVPEPGGSTVLNPEVIDRAAEMAIWGGPVSPQFAGKKGLLAHRQKIKPPSSEELLKTGGKQLEAFKNANVYYKPESIKALANKVEQDLLNDAVSPDLAPATWRIIKKLKADQPQGAMFDTKNVRALVETLQKPRAMQAGAKDSMASDRLIRALYDFVEKPNPRNIVSGDAILAGKSHLAGRGNYSAGKQAEVLTNKLRDAELKAAVANSGANVGNKYRQRAAGITSPEAAAKRRFGFSKENLAALEKVAEGTRAQNAMRNTGNFLGGGGGMGAQMPTMAGAGAGAAVGSAVGMPVVGATIGAGIPVSIGAGLKGASARSSRKMMDDIVNSILKDSPLYRQMQANPPMVQPSVAVRAGPLRAGYAGAAQSAQQPEGDPLVQYLIQRALNNSR